MSVHHRLSVRLKASTEAVEHQARAGDDDNVDPSRSPNTNLRHFTKHKALDSAAVIGKICRDALKVPTNIGKPML
jgi:hypothetical protein